MGATSPERKSRNRKPSSLSALGQIGAALVINHVGFSSGCIRVEHPFERAELLLNEPTRWNQESVKAVRDSRKTQRISTHDHTSVLMLYLTASIEADGRARFLKDIYSRDAKLLEALNGPVRIELPEG